MLVLVSSGYAMLGDVSLFYLLSCQAMYIQVRSCYVSLQYVKLGYVSLFHVRSR
jgi:hypothetical protein